MGSGRSSKKAGPEHFETPEVIKQPKSSPLQSILKGSVTFGFIALIFGYVIPSMASYKDIWEALKGISATQLLIITACFIISEFAKSAPPAIIIKKLSLVKSFIANEVSSVLSNLLPGPSGTATRYVLFRTWGITAVDFGRSTVLNTVVDNLFALMIPLFAIAPLAIENDISQRIWNIAFIGAAISILGLLLVLAIGKSESIARKIGDVSARIYTWLMGIARRPAEKNISDGVVNFRIETITILRHKWLKLVSAQIVKYISLFLILDVSFRASGISQEVLPSYVVFAGFCLVSLLTIIEITPGGLGVNEVVFATVFNYATGGQINNQVIAGVLIFRATTVIGPVILGALCYPVYTAKKSWRIELAD